MEKEHWTCPTCQKEQITPVRHEGGYAICKCWRCGWELKRLEYVREKWRDYLYLCIGSVVWFAVIVLVIVGFWLCS